VLYNIQRIAKGKQTVDVLFASNLLLYVAIMLNIVKSKNVQCHSVPILNINSNSNNSNKSKLYFISYKRENNSQKITNFFFYRLQQQQLLRRRMALMRNAGTGSSSTPVVSGPVPVPVVSAIPNVGVPQPVMSGPPAIMPSAAGGMSPSTVAVPSPAAGAMAGGMTSPHPHQPGMGMKPGGHSPSPNVLQVVKQVIFYLKKKYCRIEQMIAIQTLVLIQGSRGSSQTTRCIGW